MADESEVTLRHFLSRVEVGGRRRIGRIAPHNRNLTVPVHFILDSDFGPICGDGRHTRFVIYSLCKVKL